MRLELGTANARDQQTGEPFLAQVCLDLSKPPYKDEGLACVFLGYKGSGKSNVGAVFAEQSFGHRMPFIFCDKGSNSFGLRELGPSVVTFGDPNHPIEDRRAMRDIDSLRSMAYCTKVVESILTKGYSIVLDCAFNPRKHDINGDLDRDGHYNHPLGSFATFIRALYDVGMVIRQSCLLVVDEAHWFTPQKRSVPIQKLSTEAMALMSQESRKAGIGTVVLSPRSTYVAKEAIFDSNVQVFGRHGYHDDYKRIKQYCPDVTYNQLKGLQTGQAYLVGPNRVSFIQFNKRITPSYGDTPAFQPAVEKLPDGSDFDLPAKPVGGLGGPITISGSGSKQPVKTTVEDNDGWSKI